MGYSYEWDRHCNREEVLFLVNGYINDRQSMLNLPKYRYRLLWHGPGLSSEWHWLVRPGDEYILTISDAIGPGFKSAKERAGLLEDVW
jgi:hypothetical protein